MTYRVELTDPEFDWLFTIWRQLGPDVDDDELEVWQQIWDKLVLSTPVAGGASMADDIRLGDIARDRITGFEGMVIARTQWINNCDRIVLQPRGLDKDGQPQKTCTFDINDLILVSRDAREQPRLAVNTGGPMPDPERR